MITTAAPTQATATHDRYSCSRPREIHVQRLDRLRYQIRQAIQTGQSDDLDRAPNLIGKVVVAALEDPYHPLSKQLEQLKEIVEQADAAGQKVRTQQHWQVAPSATEPAARVYFMPQPGYPRAAKFWQLQLLLAVAMGAIVRPRLEALLGRPIEVLDNALQIARRYSVDRWSRGQFLGYLLAALDVLEPASVQVQLKGKHLLISGESIRLSPRHLKLLHTLIEASGRTVSRAGLQEAGIADPADVKRRLMEKLPEDAVLSIAPSNDGYQLLTPIEIL